jgi:hypothetical protein
MGRPATLGGRGGAGGGFRALGLNQGARMTVQFAQNAFLGFLDSVKRPPWLLGTGGYRWCSRGWLRLGVRSSIGGFGKYLG